MIINEKDVELVARVLDVINPGRSSASHIRDGEATYISTCGWVAHTWFDDDLETHVKVSLMPYSVAKYLGLPTDTD